ncbi:MAG TPA: hypothetical protein VFC90_03510 [Planctomycetota bacterium]|nr:hypothetical protein [Planctomycetota bacterium]
MRVRPPPPAPNAAFFSGDGFEGSGWNPTFMTRITKSTNSAIPMRTWLKRRSMKSFAFFPPQKHTAASA